jgi:hypothetical protein
LRFSRGPQDRDGVTNAEGPHRGGRYLHDDERVLRGELHEPRGAVDCKHLSHDPIFIASRNRRPRWPRRHGEVLPRAGRLGEGGSRAGGHGDDSQTAKVRVFFIAILPGWVRRGYRAAIDIPGTAVAGNHVA